MGIQINGNTNNINAGIGSLSIEDINELDIVGVATAANFKTGVSNLHNVGLTLSGGQIDVGSNIKIGTAGVVTATSFVGSGANLTGIDTDLVSDTSPQLGGDLSSNSNDILVADDDQIKLGTGADCSIYHSGADFAIINSTGNLNILNNSADAVQIRHGSETMIKAISDGAVELYHDDSKKFETTNTGAVISGICTATSFSGSGEGLTRTTQLSHRNVVINGDMRIAQRGSTSTGNTVGGYKTCDRWELSLTSAGTWTVTKSTTCPDGFTNSMKLDCTTANTSLSATSFLEIRTAFEGQDLRRFAKGTSGAKAITVSFYAKTNKNGTYVVELYDTDNTKIATSLYTVSNSNWNRYEFTIPASTNTGEFNNDNGKSLSLGFILAAGTNYTNGNQYGSFVQGSNLNRAAGLTVNLADSTSNYFYLTGVQMEEGEIATPFEHRSYADEFRRCARYCYQWIDDQQLGFGQVYSGSGYTKIFPPIPVNMRAKPSVTKNAPSGYWFVSYQGNSGYAGDRSVSVEGNSGDDNHQSANSFRIFVHGGSNQGNGTTVWCLIHDTAGAYLRLEAEL